MAHKRKDYWHEDENSDKRELGSQRDFQRLGRTGIVRAHGEHLLVEAATSEILSPAQCDVITYWKTRHAADDGIGMAPNVRVQGRAADRRGGPCNDQLGAPTAATSHVDCPGKSFMPSDRILSVST